mgnify:CR=1 FL=1
MSLEENLKKILIIDYGSQFTQLIARRIRDLGVYSTIISHNKYKLSEIDVLATYIKHATFQISKNIFDNEKVLISGGGSFNKTLIKSLTNYGINIYRPNNLIINYKESLIFALLGHLRLNNEINCLKSVTGAIRDHSSGDIFS